MLTALIFIAAYAVIAAGRAPFLRIDRTGAALVGAVLMVVTGAIDLDAAASAVDARTIVLLFSMMVIVAHLTLSGGLAACAAWIGCRVDRPRALVVVLVFGAGLLSALFVNDTICLVFTPMVIAVVQARQLRPLPYLLALATASNIGSAATLTGNPQNILIGALSAMPFSAFTQTLGPLSLLLLAADAALICVVFRHDLASLPSRGAPQRIRVHRVLLAKTLLVALAVLAGFLAGADTAVAASAGAAVLLVTRRVRPAKIFRAVDWDLLMLFAGLFVLVAAAERAGFDHLLFEWLRPFGVGTVAGLTLTSAVLSNAISNVPAVMLFTSVVPQLPDPHRAWLVLAASSTFAGNVTILGSIANLIVVEGARRRGIHISFWDYAKVGVPISVISLVLTILWLG